MAGLDAGSSDSPFADRASLTARGGATRLPERADELAAIREGLAPSRKARDSVGVTIYGPDGTGKTELALRAGADFEDAGGNLVHLACGVDDTAFSCSRRIANALGEDLPATGLSADTAREEAVDRLRGAAGPRCVVLDDLDALADDVRQTLLLGVIDPVDDVAVGTIATSATLGLRNRLSGDELAVIGDSERVLAPYGAEELRSIFERRARNAFRDCVVGDELLDRAVAVALDRGGDADFGLRLLAAAGDLALEEGATTVTAEHLEGARERVVVGDLADSVAALRDHHRFALQGLCTLHEAGRTPARVGSLFGAYVDACEAADREPNTERSLQNYLGRLVDAGLVESEEVRTDAGGRFNRYDLARPAGAVEAALEMVS